MSGSNTVIGTDSNNDIYQDANGDIALLSGVAALQQDCVHALQAQLREMVLAYDQGMPTMDDVFQSANLQKYSAVGITTLLAINGVTGVQSFVAQFVDGQMVYEADILTVYSPNLPLQISTGEPVNVGTTPTNSALSSADFTSDFTSDFS
jgi:hypothetical protein